MSVEDEYETLPQSSVATNMMAGALAGIAEHIVMYPLDSVKTRMQIVSSSYTGVLSSITRISQTEGIFALWRGVSSVIMGAGPSHALYFATYEKSKELFGANTSEHNFIGTGAAAVCATVAAEGLMTPFDVIKQRMQLSGREYRHVMHCGLQILKREGMRAFFVSYPTTLAMTVPFHSIHLISYETAKKTLNPSGKYDVISHVISGAIGGAMAALMTNPLDVAKTLLQTRGTSDDAMVRNASGFMDSVKVIYKRSGYTGFMRGVVPRILAHMPATAISWTTYEFMKHFIGGTRENSIPIELAVMN